MSSYIIGDTVNLASRVEGGTKFFGVPVLITDTAYRKLQNPETYDIREIDSIRVKGKQKPTVLYEIFSCDPPALREAKKHTLPLFEMALFQYKAGNFSEAKGLFQNCLEKNAADGIARIFQDRCAYLLVHPPGESWGGVSSLK